MCNLLKNKMFFVFLAGILIVLSGCSSQVLMLNTLNSKTVLEPEQGLVVAKFVNAGPYPLPFNQLTIAPENLNESKKIKPERLQALGNSTFSGSVFSSPVKSGKYSVSSIRAFHSVGDGWYSRFLSPQSDFGTFQVQPGKVTDLGTIIYYPKPQGDRYVHVFLRLPPSVPGDTVKTYFPFYEFTPENVLSWDNDDREDERQSLYVSVATNAVDYKIDYLAPDDSIYFLAKLGVILERKNNGEWALDAVPTDYDLNAIVKDENGSLVVGGDEGRVYLKLKNNDWLDISLDKTKQVMALLLNKHGYLDVITRNTKHIFVDRVNILSNDKIYKRMASFDSFNGWHDSEGNIQAVSIKKSSSGELKKKRVQKYRFIKSAEILKEKHKITITTRSMSPDSHFSPTKTKTFKYDPNTWEVSKYEESEPFSLVRDAGFLTLGVKESGYYVFSKGSNTENKNEWIKLSKKIRTCAKGTTLKGKKCFYERKKKKDRKFFMAKVKVFNFATIPWFKDENNGVAIAYFYKGDGPNRTTDTKILKTEDRGKTWLITDHELPFEYCDTLVSEVKDRLLLSCEGVSGDFYESLDFGKNWSQVREHENF